MRGRLFKSVVPVLVLFTGSLALTACGQKGPLYLPDKKPAVSQDKKQAAKEKQESAAGAASKQDGAGGAAK